MVLAFSKLEPKRNVTNEPWEQWTQVFLASLRLWGRPSRRRQTWIPQGGALHSWLLADLVNCRFAVGCFSVSFSATRSVFPVSSETGWYDNNWFVFDTPNFIWLHSSVFGGLVGTVLGCGSVLTTRMWCRETILHSFIPLIIVMLTLQKGWLFCLFSHSVTCSVKQQLSSW